MERLSLASAISNTVNAFWCDVQTRPQYQCLDIAAASTLGNSLNVSAFDLSSTTIFSNAQFIYDAYATADDASVMLFGQHDTCDGKIVGDGLINVFDIATLLAYLFRDYGYATLSDVPSTIPTVQGRDRLHLQCDDSVTRLEYLTSYTTDTCVYFDRAPPTPPPSPGRRLASASSMLRVWNNISSRERDRPQVTRQWLPVAKRHVEVDPPPMRMPSSTHMLTIEHQLWTGTWYTLRTSSLALRLHVVLGGDLSDTAEPARLSYQRFDGSSPSDPDRREVRYTRYCEFDRCDHTCASIETAHSSRTAMVRNTLELVQRPIQAACPYEVHVWIPASELVRGRECVRLEYLLIADGVRGVFGDQRECATLAGTLTYASPSTPPSSPSGVSPSLTPPSPPPLRPSTTPSARSVTLYVSVIGSVLVLLGGGTLVVMWWRRTVPPVLDTIVRVQPTMASRPPPSRAPPARPPPPKREPPRTMRGRSAI